MSNSNGGVSSSTSRVSIPNSMKKTILNIKEIAKNHSQEDIYAMLKECSMDPNETVQRLLHLDTFHQVKSKRGKKNEVVKSRPGEDSRWKPNHHVRGPRGARVNTSSQYSSSDTGGRLSNSTRKENGGEEVREKGLRNPPAPVVKKVDTVQPHHVEKPLPVPMNALVKMPNGNLGGGHDFNPDRKDTTATGASFESLLTRTPRASAEHVPSASNPVLVLLDDSLIPMAVDGTKQEASAHGPVDSGLGRTDSTSNSHPNQSDSRNVDKSPTSPSMVQTEVYKPENVLRDLPATENNHGTDRISVVKPSSPWGVGPLQGVEDGNSKLVKVRFYQGQHVIIPDHIQVPDAVKNALSFGSINASFGVKENHLKNEDIENLHSTADVAPGKAMENLSLCDKDAASPAMQAEHTDNKQPQSDLPDENPPIDSQVSSSDNNHGQPKDGSLPAVGPPFPVIQTTPSYSFGFMPPMLANTLLQPERFESQAHLSSSLASVTPQQIPLFRQPYPPIHIPYGHYLSPFYVPPNMHQYYGHTAFPPPPPTSNVFLPPPSATAATKTTSAHYKPGVNAGNQAPNGVPAGYGVYNSSQAAMTSGIPTTSGDLMPTVSKDNYMYSGQQSEGSTVWLPTPGRDPASFPLNSFLSHFPPQGHQGPFAVYHTLQPMPTLAPGLPLLQQSQPVIGPVDSVGPPSNGYQSHINWNM
ncbi:GBF-interacting protein 1-like isoform X2 [Silene latifolia]|uniref:GBF-interacting protein 1-like isoform X2 n=1 Tax=Silene latifolia TaxID=37657 RepID=UPI003D77D880